MEAMLECCAGVDVHKKSVVACVAKGALNEGEAAYTTRTFGTMVDDLRELGAWLSEEGVTAVVMESTGVYWEPVWNVLENPNWHFDLHLANPQRVKNVPARKTDKNDARWLAKLLRSGMIEKSFVPPRQVRELRDLTREHRNYVDDRSQVRNRIQKILEQGNVKLSSVLTDMFGMSGRAILDLLLESVETGEVLGREQIEPLLHGRARGKIDQLVPALRHNLTAHHVRRIRRLLTDIEHIEAQLAVIDKEIETILKAQPDFTRAVEHARTIPGVGDRSAVELISEIGVDMSVFSSAGALASWSGVAPANHESAGVQKSGYRRRGNKHIQALASQCALAAARTKDTRFSRLYRRVVANSGCHAKAIRAVAREIIVILYHLIKNDEDYRETNCTAQEQAARRRERRAVRLLQARGYEVTRVVTAA